MSGSGYLELAGAAAGKALQTFTKTALGMMALAVLLSGVAFYIAYDGSWLRGGLAVALTLVDATVVGVILSGKRAVLGGIAGGLQHQKLGQSAARMLLSSDGPIGKVAGRIPFAEAERRLRAAVEAVVGKTAQRGGIRGWLARSIQVRVVELIEQVTLTRFRAEAAQHGGDIDLEKVCNEVGELADSLLYDQVRGMMNKLTAILVLATSASAVVVAFALRQLNI